MLMKNRSDVARPKRWLRKTALYSFGNPLNASMPAIQKIIPGLKETKKDLLWGKTQDSIGYINVYQLNNEELPGVFDFAIQQLAETWALILDLPQVWDGCMLDVR